MSYKTKAAPHGRQCLTTKQDQHTRPCAGGQSLTASGMTGAQLFKSCANPTISKLAGCLPNIVVLVLHNSLRGAHLRSPVLACSNGEVFYKIFVTPASPVIGYHSCSAYLGYFRWRRCSSSRATLMICWISSPAFMPISSTRSSASSEESKKASSLPSACLRAISLRAAATKKPAVDSPLNFASSIPSKTSCGIRIDICLDLSLLVFVAMSEPINCICDSVYTKINHIKYLLCDLVCYNLNHTLSTSKKQVRHKNS